MRTVSRRGGPGAALASLTAERLEAVLPYLEKSPPARNGRAQTRDQKEKAA